MSMTGYKYNSSLPLSELAKGSKKEKATRSSLSSSCCLKRLAHIHREVGHKIHVAIDGFRLAQ